MVSTVSGSSGVAARTVRLHLPDHGHVDRAGDPTVGILGETCTKPVMPASLIGYAEAVGTLLDLLRGHLDGVRVGDVQDKRLRVSAGRTSCRSPPRRGAHPWHRPGPSCLVPRVDLQRGGQSPCRPGQQATGLCASSALLTQRQPWRDSTATLTHRAGAQSRVDRAAFDAGAQPASIPVHVTRRGIAVERYHALKSPWVSQNAGGERLMCNVHPRAVEFVTED